MSCGEGGWVGVGLHYRKHPRYLSRRTHSMLIRFESSKTIDQYGMKEKQEGSVLCPQSQPVHSSTKVLRRLCEIKKRLISLKASFKGYSSIVGIVLKEQFGDQYNDHYWAFVGLGECLCNSQVPLRPISGVDMVQCVPIRIYLFLCIRTLWGGPCEDVGSMQAVLFSKRPYT